MRKTVYILFFTLISLITYAYHPNPSPSESQPFCDSSKKALPAFVFVATETDFFEKSYFHESFRSIYEFFWPPIFSHGSGFILNEEGYIVTNAHVIHGTTEILVALPFMNFEICRASLVGSDSRTDIAILKIDNKNNLKFPYLKLGNSDNIKVGEQVIAIGNPISSHFEATITMGIISAKDRNNLGFDIEGFIQTDASINSGNSGGPLLNRDGDVVGMIRFSCNHLLGIEGLGFAIPSNTVEKIAQQIITKGKVSEGFLGIELENCTKSAFNRYFFEYSAGITISKVIENSPAEQAGLQVGDIILSVNDFPVSCAQSVKNQILILEPGEKIFLTIDRDGEIYLVSAELGSEILGEKYKTESLFCF